MMRLLTQKHQMRWNRQRQLGELSELLSAICRVQGKPGQAVEEWSFGGISHREQPWSSEGKMRSELVLLTSIHFVVGSRL